MTFFRGNNNADPPVLEIIDIDDVGKATIQKTESMPMPEILTETPDGNISLAEEPATSEVVNNSTAEKTINPEVAVENTPTRKRKRNSKLWKQNLRKEKRQSGKEYLNVKGNLVAAKGVKRLGCKTEKCCFDCEQKITFNERENINRKFWGLSDELKNHFYSKHIRRYRAIRKRTKKEVSRKTYSYDYFFYVSGVKIKICQEFFLNTLNISKTRIYYFFRKIQDPNTNVPRSPIIGKHKKKVIPDEDKDKVRAHISSFPVIESHYCRADSRKKYLERDLNIQRMYDLYKTGVEKPVKFHLYKSIFNNEFNISFFKPKKDLCDKCEAFKVNRNPNAAEIEKNEEHLRRKNIGKQERQRDREAYTKDETVGVICFDLENTFSIPKANISNFFYKMKLCCYNLTAYLDKTKIVYNAIWHEFICGRAGVHIANAIICILKRVVHDNPKLRKIIMWSDSCVPQNRNSILSFALQHFLSLPESGQLEVIEQKFGEPGHGNIQEIDAAHSCIERYIKHLEIWSPLSLIRTLLKIPNTWKLKFLIIQMKKSDYINYQLISTRFNYNEIPYSKVKHIIYNKGSIFNIKYRTSFEGELQEQKLFLLKKFRNDTGLELQFPSSIPNINITVKVTDAKKKHLFDMMEYMPEGDRNFYKSFLAPEVSSNASSTVKETSSTAERKYRKKSKIEKKQTVE